LISWERGVEKGRKFIGAYLQVTVRNSGYLLSSVSALGVGVCVVGLECCSEEQPPDVNVGGTGLADSSGA